MKLLELHILQTVAPSNLNRDDTGSPKDALFGGVRRARISSQAQKRAARDALKEYLPSQDVEALAVRTRYAARWLVRRLEGSGVPTDRAKSAVQKALSVLAIETDKTKPLKTKYLLFVGARELEKAADLLLNRLNCFESLPAEKVEGENKPKEHRELENALEALFDGGKAVDLALFGRMVADRPELGREAAAQVAHAISTHRVDREFDFYTAVDDLARNADLDTEARAHTGMMGDVEFYSATLYRYALLDLQKLVDNLQGDRDLALRGALAFLEAFTRTLPSGKQNAFAAHNPPLFVAFRAGVGLPRNLATAFERPVYPRDGKAISDLSAEALATEWKKFDDAYGKLDRERKAAMNLTKADEQILRSVFPLVPDLATLKTEVEQALQALLEV
jgi:CRISPR system Cascade subunit CasC